MVVMTHLWYSENSSAMSLELDRLHQQPVSCCNRITHPESVESVGDD